MVKDAMTHKNWETIIGLEIHVQLNTLSKMFGSEPYLFGGEPNTYIGVVSTGQPGALPVINAQAVYKAVQFGCAIQAEIPLISRFDRKSYFYPDNPKNYQITQFDFPIIKGGFIDCEVQSETKRFYIHHAHLEEDAGMLKHFATSENLNTGFSGVDYNRAGVCLLEIVSEPCLHSAQDAVAYAMGIKAIMEALDASDCNMEEGSLRIDANISIREKGEKGFRNKIEIKNMNSFSYMEAALESEIQRQKQFYLQNPNGKILAGTYRFDSEKNELVLMRAKEQAEGYRYFPEPDLPPILLTQKYIDEIKDCLPEMPRKKYQRYLQTLKLTEQSAFLLTDYPKLAAYFEENLEKCKNPIALANWITIEFPGRLKEKGISLIQCGIPSNHIVELVNLIEEGKITGKIAKSVADEMVLHPEKSPALIVKNNPDYQPLQDAQLIEALVDQILAENANSVKDYQMGKTKAFGFLVGQIMKLSKGSADPKLVNEILLKKISSF